MPRYLAVAMHLFIYGTDNYPYRGDMLKVERVQYRALKYVFCDYNASYTELRQRSKKKLLFENRLNYILYEVFKCVRKLNPSYLHEMFSIKSNVYNIRGNAEIATTCI